jgi:hypothetical protein
LAQLGEIQPTNFVLHCGNAQKQTLNYMGSGFDGRCFYDKKGAYPISTVLTYTNAITKEV